MYWHVRTRPKFRGGLGPAFDSTSGVWQGDPLSPLLFGIYIDRVEAHLARSCPGVGAHLDAHTPGPPLQVLLYADDLVLLSRDRSGLQSLLDALHTFCATNGLRVNVDKTEAVVFGGRPRDRRPMLYLGQPVPQSKSFRYLGITMYTTTGARPAPTHPHASVLRALWALQARCKALGIQDFALRARLFRSLVEPISVFSICIPPPRLAIAGHAPTVRSPR